MSQHADIVTRLTTFADKIRAEVGDSLTQRKGTQVRPSGKVPQPAAE